MSITYITSNTYLLYRTTYITSLPHYRDPRITYLSSITYITSITDNTSITYFTSIT